MNSGKIAISRKEARLYSISSQFQPSGTGWAITVIFKFNSMILTNMVQKKEVNNE